MNLKLELELELELSSSSFEVSFKLKASRHGFQDAQLEQGLVLTSSVVSESEGY